jgi:four helix bundle protein
MMLVQDIYALAGLLPAEERYGLSQQLRRAAVSVPSNIAEGHARGATKDFARFLAMARSSIAELETQLELATRLGFLEPLQPQAAISRCDKLGRILRGLRKSLDNKLADI